MSFTFITDGRQKKNAGQVGMVYPRLEAEGQKPVNLHNILGQVSLMDETRFKPPGSVLDDAKWHWCDGVPWMCSGNQDDSPRQQNLEVETKYRPPDTTNMHT